MLEKEFEYYLEHEQEFLKKYSGKYIVIKDNNVIGVYETQLEAYDESKKVYPVGTFLIQHCVVGGYKQTFHSRVAFINE